VTVDIVLFRRRSHRIEVLLIERGRDPFRGFWALPGGFVEQDEALEHAARRELQEETGLVGIQLQQLGAFGDPGRDPRGHTVSIAFRGLIEDDAGGVMAGDDAAAAQWWPATGLPSLAFDHENIIGFALEHYFGSDAPSGD